MSVKKLCDAGCSRKGLFPGYRNNPGKQTCSFISGKIFHTSLNLSNLRENIRKQTPKKLLFL
jgi:hypothetical protein